MRGFELVDGTARLAAMNLLLHGIGAPDGDSLIEVKDSLIADPGERWSVVLSNPPFGRKSSITMVGADGREAREDREIERPLRRDDREQAAELGPAHRDDPRHQRSRSRRRTGQRAVRGRRRGDAPSPAAPELRRAHGAAPADGHLLRPRRQGQCAVLRPQAGTRAALDRAAVGLRPAGQPALALKQNPLRREHLQDFVDCYLPGKPRPERVESERFRSFGYDELIARDR